MKEEKGENQKEEMGDEEEEEEEWTITEREPIERKVNSLALKVVGVN